MSEVMGTRASQGGESVSKPETQCLPECYCDCGLGELWCQHDVIVHAPACPNAPKAEAPPSWDYCIRCESVQPRGERCKRDPGRGAHEAFAWEVGMPHRKESSIHEAVCPRSNPSEQLPSRVVCLCLTRPKSEAPPAPKCDPEYCVCPPAPKDYPCARCGKRRTKDEGGTTFTVCDECWEIETDGLQPDEIETDMPLKPAPPANVSGRTMTLQTQTPGGNVSEPLDNGCGECSVCVKCAMAQVRHMDALKAQNAADSTMLQAALSDNADLRRENAALQEAHDHAQAVEFKDLTLKPKPGAGEEWKQ